MWLSGGGANLHIHRSAYSKRGKGVELHSRYTILPKYWHPLLMNRFDYFSYFYEYKS